MSVDMSPEAIAYAEHAQPVTESHQRTRQRLKDFSYAETALTIAQATALLPQIMLQHGDTAAKQAQRRRALMRGCA